MTDREKLTVAVNALESTLRALRGAIVIARPKSSFLTALLRAMSRRIEQILEEVR